MTRRRMHRWGMVAALLLAPGPLRAQSPAASASAPPAASAPAVPSADQEKLALAKDEFRKGLALLEAKNYERALDFFLRSRALVPSRQNTINAALCLENLGRHDEALDMYEEALAGFSKELSEESRGAVVAATEALRGKVGSLDLSASVEKASVSVDGRPRGGLPRSGPLRVMPGPRKVRVAKDGYATFERTVEVPAGGRVQVDARLEPLTTTGSLRVEDTTTPGAEILIDGAFVGVSPWEGVLAPGPHVISTRKGEVGSAPALVTVLQGQTALVRVKSARLGPVVRVAVNPPTAEVRLGDVPLGKGRWEGQLPPGTHRFEASEEGFFGDARSVDLTEGAPVEVSLRLRKDEGHPRWPRPATGHFWVGASGGWLGAPSMNGGVENACPAACSRHTWATGFIGEVRAGFELPSGLSPEVAVGFLSVSSEVERRVDSRPFQVDGKAYTTTYKLAELLRLKGYFLGGGVGFRVGLGSSVWLQARTSLGVVFASSSNTILTTAAQIKEPAAGPVESPSAFSPAASYELSGGTAAQTASSTPLFVAPEVGVERRRGGWALGASASVLFLPGEGPQIDQGKITASNTCKSTGAVSTGCTPENELGSRSVYGPFFLFSPRLWLTHTF